MIDLPHPEGSSSALEFQFFRQNGLSFLNLLEEKQLTLLFIIGEELRAGVLLTVLLEAGLTAEPLPAGVAGVDVFLHVDPLVLVEVLLLREAFAADGTQERFVSVVNHLVFPEDVLLGETFPAFRACVRILLQGDPQMVIQQLLSKEPFPAPGADEGFLPGVGQLVFHQGLGVLEGRPALETSEAALEGMELLVRDQIAEALEASLAPETPEGSLFYGLLRAEQQVGLTKRPGISVFRLRREVRPSPGHHVLCLLDTEGEEIVNAAPQTFRELV